MRRMRKCGAHQEECLHLVFRLDRQCIDIQNRHIASSLDFAMGLDGAKDPPAVLSINLISGQAVSDEERFNGLRAVG